MLTNRKSPAGSDTGTHPTGDKTPNALVASSRDQKRPFPVSPDMSIGPSTRTKSFDSQHHMASSPEIRSVRAATPVDNLAQQPDEPVDNWP